LHAAAIYVNDGNEGYVALQDLRHTHVYMSLDGLRRLSGLASSKELIEKELRWEEMVGAQTFDARSGAIICLSAD